MVKKRVISEEKVVDMRLFTVSKVKLLSKGREILHSVVRFMGTAAVLPITKGGKFLIEKQYRTPIDSELYEIPAGKIDVGETPENCIARELEEETGYRAIKIKKIFEAYTSCGCSDEYMHYFAALVEKIPDGERRSFPEDDEDIELFELPPEECVEMIKNRKIIDAKTIALISAYMAKIADFE